MKTKLRQSISVILSLCMIISMLSVSLLNVGAEDMTADGFSYEILEDETVEITDYNGTATNLEIPSVIDGYAVTSIGDDSFYNCTSLVSVTIPDSVTNIGSWTFNNCTSLTSVTIPDSVTDIGGCAFTYCTSLTNVTIGNGVTGIGCLSFTDTAYYNDDSNWENDVLYIGNYLIKAKETVSGDYAIKNGTLCIADEAFHDCTKLTSVVIPYGVKTIGDAAFEYCYDLASVDIPNSVTSIKDWAFNGCSSLISVDFPDSVTSIGYRAFHNCTSLTSIYIPHSVTSIGKSAFEDCDNLSQIDVDENNKVYSSIDGNLYNKTKTELILYAIGKKNSSFVIPDSVTCIGDSAFYFCKSLTNVTIPDSVTSIGEDAFIFCESLTSMDIPDSVTDIGDWAFAYCDGLVSVTIGNGVTNIGVCAFSDCIRLTSIDIPDSVTSIGDYAFEDCESLTSITVGDSVTSIGSSIFYNTAYYNDDSNWEDGVMYVDKYLIRAKDTLSGDYAVKNDTLCIADYAFYDCTNLTSVNIPENVSSIGSRAFGYYNQDGYEDLIDGFVIYGYIGSAAEQYADENDITFIALNEPTTTEPTNPEETTAPTTDPEEPSSPDEPIEQPTRPPVAEPTNPPTTEPGENTFITGDLSGDGVVDAKDRILLTRYLAKWAGYENQINLDAADINHDGVVDAKDRIYLTRYLAKWKGYESL